MRVAMPGLLLSATIALAVRFVSDGLGGPAMLYALLFGMAFNFLCDDERFASGIRIASRNILRIGVALLGLRITTGDVMDLGWPVAALILTQVLYKKVDLTMVLNGALAGLVSITAEPLGPSLFGSLLIGAVGGVIVVFTVPMLDKFKKEHTHSEDEVRFTIRGQGIFHIHPENGPVFGIHVEQGDLINVPAGTRHWFNLCDDRTIRCIRLFEDPAGWTPHYVDDPVHEGYEPICLGPNYVQGETDAKPVVDL